MVTPAPVVDFFGVTFFVTDLVVVDLRLRSGVVETDGKTRGLEWPVEARVAAMLSFRRSDRDGTAERRRD